MNFNSLLARVVLICALGGMAQACLAQDAVYPRAEDVSTIDGIMRAYYEVISGGPGVVRNLERDLSLHHPDAVIFVKSRNAQKSPVLKRISLAQFHASSKAAFESGFFESETQREVKEFGHSVQIWSRYAIRQTQDGPVIGRGINNIMLSFDGKRYWILAETWDDESKERPLP